MTGGRWLKGGFMYVHAECSNWDFVSQSNERPKTTMERDQIDRPMQPARKWGVRTPSFSFFKHRDRLAARESRTHLMPVQDLLFAQLPAQINIAALVAA